MSGVASTEQAVNTLAQINLGLPADRHCTAANFTRRVLESCIEASEDNALFFIWCSLEQAVQYQQIHFSKDLLPLGLKGVSVCVVNGKKRNMGANQQIPSTTAEYFVVAKKGDPTQTSFEKWGEVYDEDHPAPRQMDNVFKVPARWWDSLANRYPYEKPRELMRLFVNYFAQPGQLVFEGFAGTISCGLAALTRGINLVAVDNNQDTKPFLEDLYTALFDGIADLGSLDSFWENLDDLPAASLFVTQKMDRAPHYHVMQASEVADIQVVDTEPSPFVTPVVARTSTTPMRDSRAITPEDQRDPPPTSPVTSPVDPDNRTEPEITQTQESANSDQIPAGQQVIAILITPSEET